MHGMHEVGGSNPPISTIMNRFGIPVNTIAQIRARDSQCSYCQKEMVYPPSGRRQSDWATIEHLNFNGPFYWKDGLQAEDVVICCGSCNSSRGVKELREWFKSDYCMSRGINERTVSSHVRAYLKKG